VLVIGIGQTLIHGGDDDGHTKLKRVEESHTGPNYSINNILGKRRYHV